MHIKRFGKKAIRISCEAAKHAYAFLKEAVCTDMDSSFAGSEKSIVLDEDSQKIKGAKNKNKIKLKIIKEDKSSCNNDTQNNSVVLCSDKTLTWSSFNENEITNKTKHQNNIKIKNVRNSMNINLRNNITNNLDLKNKITNNLDLRNNITNNLNLGNNLDLRNNNLDAAKNINLSKFAIKKTLTLNKKLNLLKIKNMTLDDAASNKKIIRRSSVKNKIIEINKELTINNYEENIFDFAKLENITFRKNVTFDTKKALKKISIKNRGSISFEDLKFMVDLKTIKFNKMPKNVKKIGEATFSEVFYSNGLIYKIIPLEGENTPIKNFFCESLVLKTISKEEGVCNFIDAFFLEGEYTPEYLKAWDDYGYEENERPSKYSKHQKYGVIVMEYGGTSLENYNFKNMAEADNLMKKLINILENLESKYEFEHRDLHWGNVLIKDGNINLIDFSLSRLVINSKIIYDNLNNKMWLFNGNGSVDIQFNVYREMLKESSGSWSNFIPKTNVLWLSYLLEKIHSKLKFKGKTKFYNKYTYILKNSKSAKDAHSKLKKL